MSPTQTPVPPTVAIDPSVDRSTRTDLDLDFILTQLRGTFDGKLEQLMSLPSGDPACAGHAAWLDSINAALQRIHDGTYGTCDVCDGPISAARLEVVPTTTRCVGCNAT